MSYIGSHLRLLDSSSGIAGWPKGVDQEGIDFATAKAKEYLDRWGKGRLSDIQSHIYADRNAMPECLRSPMIDFINAVAYRALLANHCQEIFMLEELFNTKKDDEQWMLLKISRRDVENLKSLSWGMAAAIKKTLEKCVEQLAKYPLFDSKQREKLLAKTPT